MKQTPDLLEQVPGDEPGVQPYTGVKALMLAVLEEGINSYLHDKGRIRAEAEAWVGTMHGRSPFSFAVVCETLGLDPQAVRTALRRKREGGTVPRHWTAKSRPQVRRERITW